MSLSLDPESSGSSPWAPGAGGSSLSLDGPSQARTAAAAAGSGTMAPDAPGRLGTPLTANEAFAYLRDLGVWRDKRREELDALDSVALASSERDVFSRDMLVSMALWKAISDRYDLLEVTFDSGRVGPTEATRLSTLVWGRLDVPPGSAAGSIAPTTSGALALSLPEACRLSDAMTTSLRARLALEPSGAEVGTRVKDVRATIERIRDQVSVVPAGPDREAAATRLTRLEQRLADVTDRAKRGADVGGLLAPLEYDAAGTERDLIVGAGQRVDDARDTERARQQRTELIARGEAVSALVAQAVTAVNPAPKLAVPDVRALGPVPTAPLDVDAYLVRLNAVSRALGVVHTAYAQALAERDEVAGYAGAILAQARAGGLGAAPADEDEAHLRARLEAVLAARPLDVRHAKALLAAYQVYRRESQPTPGVKGTR
jgi:hypothetical protein